jgi:2,5-diketo-D-gluconate reductase A
MTSITLNDGTDIPSIGLGTYRLTDEEGIAAISTAIDSGYRLIDTALNYGNEREVGEAVRRSGIRDQLRITTKLPGRHHGHDETLASFAESLDNLGLDYVDLYLIHWPLPRIDKFVDSWRAMIELRDRGLVRSIGVSNFTIEHLRRLEDETGVVPSVNQIELHPRFPQGAMREYHAQHGIRTESWSPLARRNMVTDEPVVAALAAKYDRTPTQIALRWHVQLGAVPIPKSSNAARQRENLAVFDFELSPEEVEAVSGLESERLWGGDPETHEEF